jgi:hypothetical protein
MAIIEITYSQNRHGYYELTNTDLPDELDLNMPKHLVAGNTYLLENHLLNAVMRTPGWKCLSISAGRGLRSQTIVTVESDGHEPEVYEDPYNDISEYDVHGW